MMTMNFSDIAILNVKGVNFPFSISGITKSEAINVMQNINLIEKTEHYKR